MSSDTLKCERCGEEAQFICFCSSPASTLCTSDLASHLNSSANANHNLSSLSIDLQFTKNDFLRSLKLCLAHCEYLQVTYTAQMKLIMAQANQEFMERIKPLEFLETTCREAIILIAQSQYLRFEHVKEEVWSLLNPQSRNPNGLVDSFKEINPLIPLPYTRVPELLQECKVYTLEIQNLQNEIEALKIFNAEVSGTPIPEAPPQSQSLKSEAKRIETQFRAVRDIFLNKYFR